MTIILAVLAGIAAGYFGRPYIDSLRAKAGL